MCFMVIPEEGDLKNQRISHNLKVVKQDDIGCFFSQIAGILMLLKKIVFDFFFGENLLNKQKITEIGDSLLLLLVKNNNSFLLNSIMNNFRQLHFQKNYV